ncbi:hypothetical protein JOQ06_004553, partial [Pogonophryne albipinna]
RANPPPGPGLARGAPAVPRDPPHTDISNQARHNPIQGRSMPPTHAEPPGQSERRKDQSKRWWAILQTAITDSPLEDSCCTGDKPLTKDPIPSSLNGHSAKPQALDRYRRLKAILWSGGGKLGPNGDKASWIAQKHAGSRRGGWSVAKGNLPGIKGLPSTLPAEVSGMKLPCHTNKTASIFFSHQSPFPINIPFLAVTVSVLRLILPISLPLNARYLPVFAPLSQDCEQVTVIEGGEHQGQSCEEKKVITPLVDPGSQSEWILLEVVASTAA